MYASFLIAARCCADRAVTAHHCHGDISKPDRLLFRFARIVIIAQSVALFVEQGIRAAFPDKPLDLLALAVVAITHH